MTWLTMLGVGLGRNCIRQRKIGPSVLNSASRPTDRSDTRLIGTIQNGDDRAETSPKDNNNKIQPNNSGDAKPVVDISNSNVLSFLKLVKCDRLTVEERQIHKKHVQALEHGDETYTDPFTGYIVLTRLAHIRRGDCCGNACRHCPYGHKGVPQDQPKKRYNSAFFV